VSGQKWIAVMGIITAASLAGLALIQANQENEFLDARQELIETISKTNSDKIAMETYLECYSEAEKNLTCQYDAIKTAELLGDKSNTKDIQQSLSKFLFAYEKLKEIREQ
jgi:predicted negative regulator of RcsB-dependent stress response